MSTTTNTSDTATSSGTVSAGPGAETVTTILTQPDGTTQTSTVTTTADATVTGQEDFPVSFTLTQNGNYAAASSAPQTFTVSDITLTARTVTLGTFTVS